MVGMSLSYLNVSIPVKVSKDWSVLDMVSPLHRSRCRLCRFMQADGQIQADSV